MNMRKIRVILMSVAIMLFSHETFAQLFRDEISERIEPESCIFVLEKFDHPANEDCKQEQVTESK